MIFMKKSRLPKSVLIHFLMGIGWFSLIFLRWLLAYMGIIILTEYSFVLFWGGLGAGSIYIGITKYREATKP